MLPDFIGIGAQRSGTSWLYACLQEHPELCLPRKEINFFSSDEKWSRGLEWYRTHFKNCGETQQKGEYSTAYLDALKAPERIASIIPETKLIVLIRDPVERCISGYKNAISAGDISKSVSFEEALRKYPGIIEKSFYGRHLDRYLEYFAEEQIFIGQFEMISSNPRRLLENVFEFLAVDTDFEPSLLHERINSSGPTAIPGVEGLLNELAKPFRQNSLLRPIWWTFKRAGLGKFIRSLNSFSSTEPNPSENVKKNLRNQFIDDLKKLENQFNLNLKDWIPEGETSA
jgi:hypothetical protein